MKAILIAIALIAGTFNAIDAGTSTALRKGLHAPFWSLALLAVFLTNEKMPQGDAWAAVPSWGWLVGVLGFGFVSAMIYTAEDLGSALFIGLTVTASTILSMLLDHFGLLGFTPHPAAWGRIVGALFMVFGVGLIAAF
jgi:bacterial/archaeal transporter family-2 protein